jgi:hypothetical protein
MPYQYTQASRAGETHALPDVEFFYIGPSTQYDECPICPDPDYKAGDSAPDHATHKAEHVGWYYAFLDGGLDCFSGEPSGPYPTKAEALKVAREAK